MIALERHLADPGDRQALAHQVQALARPRAAVDVITEPHDAHILGIVSLLDARPDKIVQSAQVPVMAMDITDGEKHLSPGQGGRRLAPRRGLNFDAVHSRDVGHDHPGRDFLPKS